MTGSYWKPHVTVCAHKKQRKHLLQQVLNCYSTLNEQLLTSLELAKRSIWRQFFEATAVVSWGRTAVFLAGEMMEAPFLWPHISFLTGAPNFISSRSADYHQAESDGSKWASISLWYILPEVHFAFLQMSVFMCAYMRHPTTVGITAGISVKSPFRWGRLTVRGWTTSMTNHPVTLLPHS